MECLNIRFPGCLCVGYNMKHEKYYRYVTAGKSTKEAENKVTEVQDEIKNKKENIKSNEKEMKQLDKEIAELNKKLDEVYIAALTFYLDI